MWNPLLSNDIIPEIFQYLSPKELGKVCTTCKPWYNHPFIKNIIDKERQEYIHVKTYGKRPVIINVVHHNIYDYKGDISSFKETHFKISKFKNRLKFIPVKGVLFHKSKKLIRYRGSEPDDTIKEIERILQIKVKNVRCVYVYCSLCYYYDNLNPLFKEKLTEMKLKSSHCTTNVWQIYIQCTSMKNLERKTQKIINLLEEHKLPKRN